MGKLGHLELVEAARLRVDLQYPYLAAAQRSLRGPVWVPGLTVLAGGPMAVDHGWRLYVDPDAVETWTVPQIATVLRHEVWHCLRDHATRRQDRQAVAWNISADYEIDSDLIRESPPPAWPPIAHPLPGGDVEIGLLAEEYYDDLAQLVADMSGESSPDQDQPGDEPGSPDDQRQAGGEGEQDPSEGTDSSSADGDEDGSAAGEGTSPPGGSAPPGSSKVPGPGGDGSASAGAPSGQPGGTSAQVPGVPSGTSGASAGAGPASPPSGGGAGGQGSAPPGTGSGSAPGGSNADGINREWELASDGRDARGQRRGPVGVSAVEGELIRRVVAEEIKRVAESSASRGTMPAGMARWADSVLALPVVDWRPVLRRAVQEGLAAPGQDDYSYRRPSRRDPAMRRGYASPTLIAPYPETVVIGDTSGSVSDEDLRLAGGEVVGVAHACGGEVWLASCDALVYAWHRVRRGADIRWQGGGGTSMVAGIEAALKRRPRPRVIVVITDGFTDWPAEPLRGARLIVALCGTSHAAPSSCPPWAVVVEVTE